MVLFGTKDLQLILGIIYIECKSHGRWFYTNDTTMTEGLNKICSKEHGKIAVPVVPVVVPVSSASTRCSNSSRSKLNPQLMNKYNPLKELNTQKVFLATATNRKAN